MSLSFRNVMTLRTHRRAVLPALLLGASVAPVLASEVYVQPIVSVEGQTSSHIDLSPDASAHQQTQGYIADAAAVIGIATPRSDTTLKPRLQYQYYPDNADLDRLEAFLDFATQYTSQRSTFRMFGRFDHRDEINAERPVAAYSDTPTVTATTPTTTETGRVRVGATRDNLLLIPTYTFRVTPTTSLGASGTLQTTNYSPDDASSHVDYNYYQGRGFVNWSLSQRTEFALGGYMSKYDAKNIDSQSTSYGASGDFDFNWTALFSSHLSVVYQRTDIEQTQPSIFKGNTNAWGATIDTAYKSQTSQVRFTLGRVITPSGGGGLYGSDEARIQYNKELSERWQVTTAARYLHNRAISSNISGNDRNYTQGSVYLRWMATRTLFVEGGYEYSWQKYQSDITSADDNTFVLRFGYRGLQRQY